MNANMRCVRFITACFTLILFEVNYVLGLECNPRYYPSGHMRRIDVNDLFVNIIVEDERQDKDKYFFLWSMGWKSWDPDAKKFNGGQKLFLSGKPKDIINRSLSEAFTNAGYAVSEDTNTVILRFKLEKFLYTLDTWKNGPMGIAEISMKVSFEKNSRCYFTKEFNGTSNIEVDVFRQVQDAEPTLSRCLTNLVEEAATDKELKLEIFKVYGVVTIVKDTLRPPQNDEESDARSATCFLISNKGYVCTNYHVVRNAKKINVVFPSNKKSFSATTEVQDISSDLAILKLDGFDCNSVNMYEIPFAVRPSNKVKLAEKAFTIGYPLGDVLGNSPKYTEGTISSVNGWKDNANLFQISAPVQPGNSGGPLFDKDGDLIGIVVAQINMKYFFALTDTMPQNINFAIKSDYLNVLLSNIPACENVKERKGTLKDVDSQGQVEALRIFVGAVQAE